MPLRIFGGFFLFALKDYLSDDSQKLFRQIEFMGLSPAEPYSLSEAIQKEKEVARENERRNGELGGEAESEDHRKQWGT